MRARNRIFFVVLALFVAQNAVAQFHFEMGFNAPAGYGVVNDKGLYGEFTNVLKEVGFLPIPFTSIHVGAFDQRGGIGIGIKAHSAIIATVAYPSVMGEISCSNFSIDASLGGLYALHYVIGGNFGITPIPALVSELSIWYALGRKSILRVGGGVSAIFPSDFSFSEMPYVGWIGLKAVL
jgi:hypothetical protein